MEIKKWEYKREDFKLTYDDSDFIKFLNEQGNEGWELVDLQPNILVAIQYYGIIFKREIIKK